MKSYMDMVNCKLCMLNGRLDVHNDNFTYIPDKGKSVVDYIIVPQDCYNKCTHFKVHTMNEMSEKCNVAQYLSQNCKLPGHSILQVNFKLSEDTNINNEELHHNDEYNHGVNFYNQKTYNFNNVPDLFLMNDTLRQTMANLIDQMIMCRNLQLDIDNIYTQFYVILTA